MAMTKCNLCDTCLHRAVCRHSTDPAGTAMVSCVYYDCPDWMRGQVEFVPELVWEDEK